MFRQGDGQPNHRTWPTSVETAKDRATPVNYLDGRHAFPRTARLLKPADFNRVFKNSSASSDRYFKVLARPNGSNGSRLGLAVSRKVDKRAVGRNRIKRVARESFRHSFDTLSTALTEPPIQGVAAGGLDLVVLPRQLCASICNGQLRQSLDAHWLRLQNTIQSGTRPAEKKAGRT